MGSKRVLEHYLVPNRQTKNITVVKLLTQAFHSFLLGINDTKVTKKATMYAGVNRR